MKEEDFLRISTILEQICERTTDDYKSINPNVRFCLYQDIEKYEEQPFCPYDIVRFYNMNWTGNKDFMHIPNFNEVLEYIESYPIIIAYDTLTKDLLGISILKYNEITNNHIDPYFPEPGAKYFSMTGILTNPENSKNGLRGIGNKIYEIELASILFYKEFPGCKDTRVVCVIDCRNKHSIFALNKAVEDLGKSFKMDRLKMEFPVSVVACYYIIGNNKELTEAPTLVMEVGLDPKREKEAIPRKLIFNQETNLNESLLKTVFQSFAIDTSKEISFNKDMKLDGVNVVYVRFEKDANQLKNFSTIITNDTEKGNDRIPLTELEIVSQIAGDNAIEKPKIKKLALI